MDLSTSNDGVQAAMTYALGCAKRQWYVFPCWWIGPAGECGCGGREECSPGKHPIGDCAPRGVLDASVYPRTIQQWWARFPNANLALACGPSGLIIVDIDLRHGGDEAAFWAKVGGQVETVRTITPGGGVHLWFTAPPGEFTVSVGKFLPGIDIRAGAGYVMLPPSRHSSGGVYQFEIGYSPKDIAPAPAPAILAEFARIKKDPNGTLNGHTNGHGPTGFDLLRALAGVGEGERDDQIFRAACSLRAENVSQQLAVQLISEAALKCDPPFPVQSAIKKVAAAYKKYKPGHDKPAPPVESGSDERPSITVIAGQAAEIVDKAESVLVEQAEQLRMFQRAGQVVRIVSLTREAAAKAEKRDKIKRQPGSLVLHAVEPTGLMDTFDRIIVWKRYNRSTDEVVPADCPDRVAKTYLSRVGEWRLPYLTGIISAPCLRPDGSILSTPGYDAATGLYLDTSEPWNIPEEPTIDDASAAWGVLMAPFEEFPFVSAAAKSVLLAGILTALQRRLLESAPFFVFTASTPRSGKSLLAESIGLIAMGHKPPSTSVPDDEESLKKAILSMLIEGSLITQLDNIDRPLASASLSMVLTQAEYRDRLLGATKMVTAPTNMMWTGTGNNVIVVRDMTSRSLQCEIDPGVERPEERKFAIKNLPAHLKAHRIALVTSALTLLRAYHVAGCPEQDIKPWGGFDEWSQQIRQPIVWLGLADPYETRNEVLAEDPERDATTEVFRQWIANVGDEPILLRELINVAKERDEFKAALLAVAAMRGSDDIDSRRLSRWCRESKNRVVSGLRLIAIKGSDTNSRRWRVVRAGS